MTLFFSPGQNIYLTSEYYSGQFTPYRKRRRFFARQYFFRTIFRDFLVLIQKHKTRNEFRYINLNLMVTLARLTTLLKIVFGLQ